MKQHYRPDLDGLRGIAILLVLFYHLGIEFFRGGYIGVDIFFVLSGYLITRSTYDKIQERNFNFAEFVLRRIKRLLPALCIVTTVSIALSFMFLPPKDLLTFLKSTSTAFTLTSNYHFWAQNDYFDISSRLKPFIHMWSLSVEEQYYLLMPFLLLLLRNICSKLIFRVYALLVLASYLLSIFPEKLGGFSIMALNGEPSQWSFYSLIPRFWEIGFGSLIGMFTMEKKIRGVTKFNVLIGYLLIILSLIVGGKFNLVPAFYAAPACLGTALIILSNERSLGKKLIESRLLVFIGLISYSLYLWHQPLFAFLQYSFIGEPPAIFSFFTLGTSFTLAFLTWKNIETPFRVNRNIPRQYWFLFYLGFLLSTVGIYKIVLSNKGFPQRFSSESLDLSKNLTPSPMRETCHTRGTNYLPPDKSCKYFEGPVEWIVLGDSHGVELAFALAERVKSRNVSVQQLTFSNCSPAFKYESDVPGCTKWIRDSIEYVVAQTEVKKVILTFRMSYHLFGDQLDVFPDLPDTSPKIKSSLAPERLREIMWESYMSLIKFLISENKTVYVLFPIPELGAHINQYIMQPFKKIDYNQSVPLEYYKERNNYVRTRLEKLPWSHKLIKMDPESTFCDEKRCFLFWNNKPLYFDDDHLSLEGANLFLSRNKEILDPTIP